MPWPLLFSLSSSPALKAQVSYLEHQLSTQGLSVNFSYFHLLPQTHLATFNQTWYEVCSNQEPCTFPRGYTIVT